ncbi:MAG: ion transporter, partial [Alphaproteobacteria bacterium]|nr:ion transporter [Alphaproteobacteria bacterium]
MLKTYRRKLFEVIEMGRGGNRAAVLFDGFMVVLIVFNVISVLVETEPGIARIYSGKLIVFEAFSLAVFCLEYLLRIWVSVEYRSDPDKKGKALFRLRFILSPLMVIDFLAIAPSLMFVTGFDFRLLRIFRLLRLFKLMRYSPALASLGSVLYLERRALFATLVIMLGLSAFAATIMYNLERFAQPEVFGTIPAALWWALSTLTTVGYGDVVPITGAGRFFGAIVMIFGVGMYALPIGII